MFEEYFKAAKANETPGKTFRLKIWLFEAKEEELTPEDIGKAKRYVPIRILCDSCSFDLMTYLVGMQDFTRRMKYCCTLFCNTWASLVVKWTSRICAC